MTPPQAQKIKDEINRLTLELHKHDPAAVDRPQSLELVEAYHELCNISRGESEA